MKMCWIGHSKTLTVATFAIMLHVAVPGFAGISSLPPKSDDFKITEVRQWVRQAPRYGGSGDLGGVVPSANRPWMRIEADFTSKPDWADNVTVKFYVLIGQGREAKMFTAEQTYMNVRKGSFHHAAVFVHPNTLDRYGQGHIQALAVQLFHNNRLEDQTTDPKTDARWWEQHTPVTGVLRAPRETPWCVVEYTRYEETQQTP